MLRNAFEQLVKLSDEEWADAENRFVPVSFTKDEVITREGTIEPYFYFILNGVHRMYYVTPDGNEVVLGFSFDGNFSGAYDSFCVQKPSYLNIQALTAGNALAIGFNDYNHLLSSYKNFERWGRLFAQLILFGRGKREIEMLSTTAQERCNAFVKRMPANLQQILLRHIASYLNMTAETLSRIRAKR